MCNAMGKTAPIASDAQIEQQAWAAAQSGKTTAGYSAYLKEYPKGRFAAAARVAWASVAGQEVSQAPVQAPTAAPAQPAGLTAGQVIKDCADCPEMLMIPGGSFEMGSTESTDEQPRHPVQVPAFLLGRTEVTQGQWQAVMGSNPSYFKACGLDCPVENVTWNDAQDFARRLSQKTGKTYRLPSEAEWEYAARAGSRGKWSFGDYELQLVAHAWFRSNSGLTPHPAAQKRPNAFGLHDMHGNAWEWVRDTWHVNYQGAPSDGSAWVDGGDQARRVLRGGAWFNDPSILRSAVRNHIEPGDRLDGTGLRIARSIADPPLMSHSSTSVATPANMDVATCEKPVYPKAALNANADGITKVYFVIDELGKVSSTNILRSSGDSPEHKLLDQAAVEALIKCKFNPGKDIGGFSVGGSKSVDYVWKKYETPIAPNFQAVSASIDVSTCEKPDYPEVALRAGATGTSKIRFTVAATGYISKAEILRSSGASREHRLLDRTAIEALSKCRFKPGSDSEGKPIGGTSVVNYNWEKK